MALYKLYAGLGGSFGGATCQGVYEFDTVEEAEKAAYQLAWDEYQSYEGYHGLLDWDQCYEDLLESEMIEPGAQTQGEIEDIVDAHYIDNVETWIEWSVEEVDGYTVDEDDDPDYFCDDEDDDDYDDEESDPDCIFD